MMPAKANATGRRRVACPVGHWSTVRLVLEDDLVTVKVATGQRCAICRRPIDRLDYRVGATFVEPPTATDDEVAELFAAGHLAMHRTIKASER